MNYSLGNQQPDEIERPAKGQYRAVRDRERERERKSALGTTSKGFSQDRGETRAWEHWGKGSGQGKVNSPSFDTFSQAVQGPLFCGLSPRAVFGLRTEVSM